MSENIYLRVPLEVAKSQLENRLSIQTGQSFDRYEDCIARAQWSELNISVLEAMFSSTQIAERYKEFLKARGINTRKISSSERDQIKNYLKQLLESLPAFTELPKVQTAASRTDTPTTSPRSPDPQVTQWEFYSVIVDDPSLGAHIEKPVYEQTLKKLASDGWELVSAVPAIYSEEKDRLFLQAHVEAYRLFFKRPVRRISDM